jgi:hypothetical protein
MPKLVVWTLKFFILWPQLNPDFRVPQDLLLDYILVPINWDCFSRTNLSCWSHNFAMVLLGQEKTILILAHPKLELGSECRNSLC